MRDSATYSASVRALSIESAGEPLVLGSLEGLHVVRAASRAALEQALAAADYDLAIVDARLRWISPEELRAILIAAAPARPIIVLTDREQSSEWEHARRVVDATLPRTEQGRLTLVIAACLARAARRAERTRLLVDVADATRPLEKPEEIAEVTMSLLREALGADRCVYGDVEADDRHFDLTAVACKPGVAPISGRFPITAAGEQAFAALRAGRPFVRADRAPEAAPSGAERRWTDARAVIAVPLVKGGRLAAVAGVHMLSAREWTDEEVELVDLVAEGLWEAMERARVSRALRESEAEFRALFELSAVGVAQADPVTGRYVRANRRFCEITGYDLAELRNLSFSDLTHPEDRERNAAVIGVVLRGDADRWDIEKRYVRANGTVVWVRVSGQLMRDSQGNPIRLIANAIDVSEQKRVERALIDSRRQLQVVTDSAPVMLASCGADYRFKFVNRAYAARYGLDPREIVGRTFAEVAGEEAFTALKANADRALRGERSDFEAEVRYRDLGAQWIRCAYAPERDEEGRVVGWVAAILDITARKRAEEALLEADRRKNEFLAVLGHELRNPLAPLRTGVELLKHADQNAELLANLRAMMERQLGHLIRLVDDLLDLSRISRGEVELQRERLDLHTVIDAAVELSRPVLVERRHSLVLHHAPIPLPIEGDFQRLTQVVGNLLSNAAKYTDPGGTIELSTEAVEGWVQLRVRDTGYGLPAETLERVFEMFTQVPEHRARTGGGGLGIGLALSRQLVTLHGGTIEARSAGLGQGSEFVVKLPLARRARGRRDRGVSAGGAPDPRRVLVVDDNLDAAESLRQLLELEGHTVHVAHGGRAAVDAVESFAPHVVLLDIGLPGMDGYEVARRIRATRHGAKVLLLALTGWAQEEDKRRARDAGFDRHLTKPVDVETLEALIAAAPRRAAGA